MKYITLAKDWITDRVGERTSLDGIALIAISGSIILFGGIVKLAAWVGLGYGIYTLVKKEG
jgi:EamA domain-containing membrane protein RarD